MKEIEFDLLITDIKMPGIDGLELIRELKNIFSFEAIVISGFNDFKYLQTAIREGAVDYLVKPIIRDEFRQQLQRVKEKIHQQRAEVEHMEEINSKLNFVKQTKKIVQSLEHYQMENEIFNHLNQFLNDLEKIESPQEIEQNIQSLTVQIVNHVVKSSNHIMDETPLIQEALYLTKRASNFNVLRYNLKEWVQKVLKVLHPKNKQETIDPIQTAKKYVLCNLGENLTIGKIAREIPMNPTYFCEYFKNQTGETVLDFVTKTRIEKAKTLLLTTDLKIYVIAEKVGYTDTKYFSKLFKKYLGEVPSKFKENIKYR
jgi:YesN/AraC family two-component response regulator